MARLMDGLDKKTSDAILAYLEVVYNQNDERVMEATKIVEQLSRANARILHHARAICIDNNDTDSFGSQQLELSFETKARHYWNSIDGSLMWVPRERISAVLAPVEEMVIAVSPKEFCTIQEIREGRARVISTNGNGKKTRRALGRGLKEIQSEGRR